MNLSSPWFSLTPLLIFNVILLCTVLIFRPIYRNKDRSTVIENRHASKFLNRWMREYWEWLTTPLVRFFIKIKLTPNRLTLIGVLVSFVSGYFFWKGHFGLGGWFMIFAASFDMFDGRVARETNNETKAGGYFDAVMDRVSEGVGFLGMAMYFRDHWALWIVFIALMGSFMVSYTRAKGGESGVSYSGGSMQRPERIVYLGVGAIFAPLFAWIINPLFPSIFYHDLSDILYMFPLGFVALMTWVTTFDRMKHIIDILDEREKGKKPK